MSDREIHRLKAIACAYESRLVPAVFDIWTEAVCTAAGVGPGDRVLDVACGTGVLARRAAARTGPAGRVDGLDLNPGMLALAADIAPAIHWHQGDAADLPFDDGVFDAVISQFGLMFFPDRQAALREMARVLRPGGRLAVAVFGGLETNTVYDRLAGVFERHAGADVGAALRSPFSCGNTDDLRDLLSAAGFGDVAIGADTREERFSSVRELVLSDVEGWFPLAGFALDGETVDAVIADTSAELPDIVGDDSRVRFPVTAHIASGRTAAEG